MNEQDLVELELTLERVSKDLNILRNIKSTTLRQLKVLHMSDEVSEQGG